MVNRSLLPVQSRRTSCPGAQATRTLSIRVKGAGLLRAMVSAKPVEDRVKSWTLDADCIEKVRAILTERVSLAKPLGLSQSAIAER
jgi:hypothetical protein